MQIAGAHVLLTGATGGLGQAIARELAGRGARLTLTARREQVLNALASELDARAVTVDLSDRHDVERLVGDAGAVEVLVANAALPASGRLDTFTTAQLDRALEVNLRAPIALARALVPGMVSSGQGQLVFMSSLSGKVTSPGTSLYNATKFGLRGFALALRAELRESGVGVSGVFPGFIREAGMFAESGAKLPPGVGTKSPQDVARAVVEAIEHDRAEVDVAPLALRVSAAFAGLAPEAAARLGRRLGADDVAAGLAAGQTDKR